MHIRDHPGIAAAILLAGLLSGYSLLGGGAWWPPAFTSGDKGGLALSQSGTRIALEWCRENVNIIHDVHWANACAAHAEQQLARQAACVRARASAAAPEAARCDTDAQAPDDSPDCTLPDALALPLNTARANAEQACLVEARTADSKGAGRRR